MKMTIPFQGKLPKVDPAVFIAENAMIIGAVEIKSGANIWFQGILRGDVNYIRIGTNCGVQDPTDRPELPRSKSNLRRVRLRPGSRIFWGTI